MAIKSRLETEIVEVHFADGALVTAGDLLFTLDSRQLQAQIRQAEGVLAGDKARSKRPSATSGAIPSWSPRTRPR